MTIHVQQFCKQLWDARDRGRLPEASVISRGLALAVAADVLACAGYDPALDRRARWANEVIARRAFGGKPRAGAELEFLMRGMLGAERLICLSGKDYAAGETRNSEGGTREEEELFPSTINSQLSTIS